MATVNLAETKETKKETSPLWHPIVEDRVIAGDGTTAATWQNWAGLHELPCLDIATQFAASRRVCVLAPHPDDEIAGCGGLLQRLTHQGNPLTIIHISHGSKSHPNSRLYPEAKLAQIRLLESQLAAATLELPQDISRICLNFSDGDLSAELPHIVERLSQLVRPQDILITPLLHDGHPDHEATAKAAEQIMHHHGKTLGLNWYQVLIWAWHWAEPADCRIPWQQARQLALLDDERALKRLALQCFTSQTQPDASTGQAPILPPHVLERFDRLPEVYLSSML